MSYQVLIEAGYISSEREHTEGSTLPVVSLEMMNTKEKYIAISLTLALLAKPAPLESSLAKLNPSMVTICFPSTLPFDNCKDIFLGIGCSV